MSKPPYIAGDVHKWSSSSASHICDVCNGVKIISTQIPVWLDMSKTVFIKEE